MDWINFVIFGDKLGSMQWIVLVLYREDTGSHRGPNAKPGRMVGRDGKVSRLQNQVDEVVTVMKDNVNKVIERGDRLDDLQDKSDNLTLSAESFRTKARSVRSQMWWKECKMRLLVAFVVIIILLIIIVPIIVQYTKKT